VLWLQINNVHRPGHREDVMVTSDAFVEPKRTHQLNQVTKADVGVGATREDTA
jgi:hypothetical protein